MIRLDNTTRKLQAVLAGAITTNQLPVTVFWSDKVTRTSYTGGATVTNTNSTTAVDICSAPAASTVRDVDTINVNNADTVTATITIRYNDNGTTYTLFKAVLATGDQLTYVHGVGWTVLDSTGKTKVGSGINGPTSSTDNALVRWDGTGGTAIQNSGWTLSDTDVLNGVSGSVGLPSLILNGETTSGLYRIAANNHGYAISGAKVLDISATGLAVTGAGSYTGNLTVSGTGPHAIGGATDAQIVLYLRGAFTGSALSYGLNVGYVLTATAGNNAFLCNIDGTLNKAAASTHTDFAALNVAPPTIGAGAATLTNASTLKINGAPTAGTVNRALWVAAGSVSIGGANATGATSGHLSIPTSAGAPTGVPADPATGTVALQFDTTNNRLYVYDGAWLSVALA